MPYNIPVLDALKNYGVEIVCIHNDLNKLTPYVHNNIEGIRFIRKSSISLKRLWILARGFQPDIVFVTDRTIWEYNLIATYFKHLRIPVICGNDTQWTGGKKWINVLTAFIRHNRYFSHMQVAGLRQFEYAKRLGYPNDRIIWPLYSADTKCFEMLPLSYQRFVHAHDVLFVGRLTRSKGVQILINSWSQIDNGRSQLHLVGNGDFLKDLKVPQNVQIHSFSTQKELLELSKRCRVFVLPSLREPWGVVLHEFAAAGLPLISTNVCGASDHFIVNNSNGFVITPNRSDILANKIKWILDASPQKLFEMGLLSRELSRTITPERVAKAILSVINEQ